MTDQQPLTHDDYAISAESAERGTAWPQAARLWRMAAERLDTTGHPTAQTEDLLARYMAAATECDHQEQIDQALERIARSHLNIPTLHERKSDSLDFHEVGVWSLRRALRAAYDAGHQASTKSTKTTSQK